MSLEKNQKILNYLKFIDKGWNGYSADKFDESFINFVIDLLPELSHQPTLFPTARNSIQFNYIIDFENHPQTYIDIEIWNDSFEILIQNDSINFEKTISKQEKISSNIINEVLEGLYQGGFLFD